MTTQISGDTGINKVQASIITATKLAAGMPAQVVPFNYGTVFSTASATPVATPFTASIQTRDLSSKVVIQFSLGDVVTNSPANGVGISIYRNGVFLVKTNFRAAYYNSGATTVRNGGPAFYSDIPASVGPVTYAIYIDNGGGGTAYVCFENTEGALILTEVAG